MKKLQFLKEMVNNLNKADFVISKEDEDKIVIIGRVKKK